MDELKKGEKVITDKYGRTQIVSSKPVAVPKKTVSKAAAAMKGSTKPTVGSPKSQTKYFPRTKKGSPTTLLKPKNSGGKKANAASSPFYGRPSRK